MKKRKYGIRDHLNALFVLSLLVGSALVSTLIAILLVAGGGYLLNSLVFGVALTHEFWLKAFVIDFLIGMFLVLPALVLVFLVGYVFYREYQNILEQESGYRN